jgi:hypothetical protein
MGATVAKRLNIFLPFLWPPITVVGPGVRFPSLAA